VLRHERATLFTTAATLVITVALYAVVPKGFLPLQDTGLVTAVMEAGPEDAEGSDLERKLRSAWDRISGKK
jgi:multidrug efflux pump